GSTPHQSSFRRFEYSEPSDKGEYGEQGDQQGYLEFQSAAHHGESKGRQGSQHDPQDEPRFARRFGKYPASRDEEEQRIERDPQRPGDRDPFDSESTSQPPEGENVEWEFG